MEERKGMDQPVVSVIMPAYNMEAYIHQAIASVVAQTMTQWELIIVDDCSADSTISIIGSWEEKDERIRVFCNEVNSGVSRTRNRGMELARGIYIAFLDSDDIWHPEKLQRQLDKMAAENAQIGYCSYSIIDASGVRVRGDYIVPEKVCFEDLLKENSIQCSSMLIRADLLKDVRFTADFYHEDYVLGLQLLRKGYQAAGCTEVLSCWRYIENSRSFNKLKAAKNRWKIYREFLGLPLGKSLYVFSHYVSAGLRKYTRKNK